jgi:Cu(I)/Ag(I) efflux system membrane protein CusA/SilA
MIDSILHFSVRHKLAMVLTALIGCGFGYWCLVNMRMDAIPDLGETQVILLTRWDRSPDLIENQVTYPIVTALLGAPHVKAVRGISDFGSSYVYVIFDDNTDIYWARSRTMEYLSSVLPRLPEGAKVELGPDATSLGWIFQYVLTDTTGQHNLAQLRSYQDWYLRYYLRSVPGVADVASVGGFERQYQVNLDPRLLQRYGISVTQVVDAVRGTNEETSGRMLDFGGTEYMVRGRGYAKSLEEFRTTVVATAKPGTPVRVGDLGEVVLGPDLRRGIADLNGNGDVVSGIVIMRNGEDTLQVINRVKAKLQEIAPGLPKGVELRPVYDRSELIHHTVSSVEWMILEVMITVAVIILIFLWHAPSALTPLVIMPVAVLLAFIPLRWMGVSLNVMSMAGIAIAIGELVDASVVIAEQIQKRLELWERCGCPGRRSDCVFGAVKEVARPTFFALLVIAVAMLPILTLEAQEGKMFRPLALAKLSAVLAASLLTLTLDPALRLLIAKLQPVRMKWPWLERGVNGLLVGRVPSEDSHLISGFLHRVYAPVIPWVLRWRWWVLGGVALLMVATIPAFLHIGSEYMPPMDEGAILYMPTTMPGISVAVAQRVLQATDRLLTQFPEVDQVVGKAGRSENATDPAPLSMFETLITLKPRSEWRHVPTWYSRWAPGWITSILRHLSHDTLSSAELVDEMNAALKVPGFTNAWTMPIKGRVDMLTSGVRTPLGLRITGADPKILEELGTRAAALLQGVRGTRGVFAEQTNLGHYIDVNWKREELSRYGVSVAQAQQVVNSAIGGDNVTTVYSGPERYGVNVRYMRDFRGNVDALGRVLVVGAGGQMIPVRDLATLQVSNGPSMLREENGLLTTYVYIDPADRDPESYVVDARRLLSANLSVPAGYTLSWAGQYEAMARVNHRLRFVIPATAALVLLLIFLSTRSLAKTLIVMLAVPFSAIGAIWLLYLLHYNMSVAVWVGLIGLASIDAETGVFMLLYLDLAYAEAKQQNRLNSLADLHRVIRYGAVKRLRPKFMTFAAACIGLLPIMWSAGAGADVLKRIAAPMVGGIFTSFLLELLVLPVVYEMWRRRSLMPASDNWTTKEVDSPLPAYAAARHETVPGIG